MNKTSNPLDQLIKNSTEFSSQCSDACTKSTSILMKGLENIVGTATALIQSSTEKQTKYIKQAMSSKDINELADIQGKMFQDNMDDLLSGVTKISELSIKVLSDSSEPLNAELNKAVKKATSSIAA
ncbi:MAG: phasin family protein [Alphaproteobacteria bacterium]|nr:phasin family protein [Alphaproteobacteria bacterium]